MFKENEDSKQINQTVTVEIEYGDDQSELVEVESVLWTELARVAENNENDVGEELAEILAGDLVD